VLHELLLGDTLMLAPLLAALRRRYPVAEIFVTARPAYAGLFRGRPYGAVVLPFSEREPRAFAALSPAKGCDIAILPGENRLAAVARALGAKWLVAHAGGRPGWYERMTDERVPFPAAPMALADMFALLAAPDQGDLRYRASDWPAPEYRDFSRPTSRYAVLHVGAGSPLRLWEAAKWREVADSLSARGVAPVWTAGKDESALVRDIDPDGRFQSYAGLLDLAQLWHLLASARCAVTLDTGVAHMAKLTCTPVVTLFGPGSAVLFGKGAFWQESDFSEVMSGIACRDQQHLFKRRVDWVRRCNRSAIDCPRARCMDAIAPVQVLTALQVE
jgi:ADP-heptose:LPS heptosyltransferase